MRTGVRTGGRARAKPRREAGTGTPGQRDGAVGMRMCSEDLDLLLMCRSERGQHDTRPKREGKACRAVRGGRGSQAMRRERHKQDCKPREAPEGRGGPRQPALQKRPLAEGRADREPAPGAFHPAQGHRQTGTWPFPAQETEVLRHPGPKEKRGTA